MLANPNRAVAVLTPLLFAPAAGAISAAAAKYGLDVDNGQLQAIFIGGATIALAKSGLWMKGWQDYEKRQEALTVDPLASLSEPNLEPDETGAPDVAELEHDVDLPDEEFDFEAAELLADAEA